MVRDVDEVIVKRDGAGVGRHRAAAAEFVSLGARSRPRRRSRTLGLSIRLSRTAADARRSRVRPPVSIRWSTTSNWCAPLDSPTAQRSRGSRSRRRSAPPARVRSPPQGGMATGSLVALAPGGAYGGAKRWPPEYFAALARELASDGLRTVIVGTAADERTRRRDRVGSWPGRSHASLMLSAVPTCRRWPACCRTFAPSWRTTRAWCISLRRSACRRRPSSGRPTSASPPRAPLPRTRSSPIRSGVVRACFANARSITAACEVFPWRRRPTPPGG